MLGWMPNWVLMLTDPLSLFYYCFIYFSKWLTITCNCRWHIGWTKETLRKRSDFFANSNSYKVCVFGENQTSGLVPYPHWSTLFLFLQRSQSWLIMWVQRSILYNIYFHPQNCTFTFNKSFKVWQSFYLFLIWKWLVIQTVILASWTVECGVLC